MSTAVAPFLVYAPHQVQCPVRGDPPAPVPQPFHAVFKTSTHASLFPVTEACTPPGPITVHVLDGSSGRKVSMSLERSDTIGKLQKMFLQERPDLARSLNLACNGKPVLEHQTLAELRVKEGVTFITFQKCVGG
ncbi:hypothetical protein MATL_G00221680 [Megalops atlanticus]|uniref:Ubiquitin-like domain-containing protein n=1 Tax=Megalops atlanticus TaxID=7932 RepID=A0A9D3PI35_MEGAT|nr:hypothetical protein MATL_G00221680 [Megalops atlanticus]